MLAKRKYFEMECPNRDVANRLNEYQKKNNCIISVDYIGPLNPALTDSNLVIVIFHKTYYEGV